MIIQLGCEDMPIVNYCEQLIIRSFSVIDNVLGITGNILLFENDVTKKDLDSTINSDVYIINALYRLTWFNDTIKNALLAWKEPLRHMNCVIDLNKYREVFYDIINNKSDKLSHYIDNYINHNKYSIKFLEKPIYTEFLDEILKTTTILLLPEDIDDKQSIAPLVGNITAAISYLTLLFDACAYGIRTGYVEYQTLTQLLNPHPICMKTCDLSLFEFVYYYIIFHVEIIITRCQYTYHIPDGIQTGTYKGVPGGRLYRPFITFDIDVPM